MAQDPEGRPGIDGHVAVDDWKPNPEACQHGIYPDPEELAKLAAQGIDAIAKLRERNEREWEESARGIEREIREAIDTGDWEQVLNAFDAFDLLPAHVQKAHRLPYNRDFMSQVARRGLADKERRRRGLPSNDPVDKFIEHQRELETRPAPKPSTDYSADNAWILPDGKFYPLKSSMEHIWGAHAIAGVTETEAENLGWVKVRNTEITGFDVYSTKPPTQSQLNTAFKWSQKSIHREPVFDKWMERWSEGDGTR